MKRVIGLINEFEGDAPLFFDLDNKETPQELVIYIVNNIEKNEIKEFIVKDMTEEEFAALEN